MVNYQLFEVNRGWFINMDLPLIPLVYDFQNAKGGQNLQGDLTVRRDSLVVTSCSHWYGDGCTENVHVIEVPTSRRDFVILYSKHHTPGK